MLKYKRTDVVVYFSDKELEYRRVDECWEVHLDGMWRLSKDCDFIESQYKQRICLRNLIMKRDVLATSSSFARDNSNENDLSTIVRKLIDTLGISVYMSNTTQELLDKLDTGEIEIK